MPRTITVEQANRMLRHIESFTKLRFEFKDHDGKLALSMSKPEEPDEADWWKNDD